MSDLSTQGFDPFSPENWHDPYPLYDELRERDPQHLAPTGEWILTRWQDCATVLRDPTWSTDPSHRRDQRPVEERSVREALVDTDFKVLLFMDPPDHTRLRRLVSRAFTPRSIEQLRPHITELVDDLLDGLVADSGGEPVDLISGLAYPLPVTVICELMGVPVEDRHLFGDWSSDASRLLDGDLDAETTQRGLMAAAGLIGYFNDLFDERRKRPADDLVSHLLAVEEEGDRLTEIELRSITLLLFIAGHETTMNLIGNGTKALLEHRDQWQRLVDDPDLAASATEELLRFDSPVHLTGRVATEDREVDGRRFETGTQVVTFLAAANRDPARFTDPTALDIGREDNQHLSFSLGIHHCLGAALARVEGQVTFGRLAQRFPGLELATDRLQYRDHFVLRGLRELPVQLNAG